MHRTCRDCGKRLRVRRDDRMPKHNTPTMGNPYRYKAKPCPGSGVMFYHPLDRGEVDGKMEEELDKGSVIL